MKNEDKNTKVYGSRPPRKNNNEPIDVYGTFSPRNEENDIVLVYGCYPPEQEKQEEQKNRREVEIQEIKNYLSSFVPDNAKNNFKKELESLNEEQIEIIKYLIDLTEKSKKILYIKQKTENIDKFIDLNIYQIHSELKDLSDNMLNFIFEIIKAYEGEKSEEQTSMIMPEDFNEKQTKLTIIRISEQVVRITFKEYFNELVDIFADTVKSLNENMAFYLIKILTKKV